MNDTVANTIRELSEEETASVGGGFGAKQYMPYTPPSQDPFPSSPIEVVHHKIHY